jgi:lysophospholipase L1-like esterase
MTRNIHFMNRSNRTELLAWLIPALLTLFISCLALELSARWFYSRPSMHFGVEMWKYAKNVKIRADNPEMSHRHRPGARAFLMGVDVNINSLGFRDREIAAAKPAGVYRIVALGDSTTFGWGVPFEQTYPKVLEARLNAHPLIPDCRKYEVINTGIGNYNTAQEVAAFKERVLRPHPDLVMIGWYINDAEPTPRPSNNWLAYHSYGYVWLTSNLDALTRNVGASGSYRDYYERLYLPTQPGWAKCQAAFAELAALCRQRGIPLDILLIPELHTLSGNYEFTKIHDLIRDIGKSNAVPVLDLIEAFPPDGDPRQFWVCPEDAHPNGRANERMAARIDEFLRKDHRIK